MATNKELAKFLQKKIRTWRGIDFTGNGDAISMYQTFNLSGVDYKGQVSSGFGEKGIQVELDLDISLLDFIAPGIPGLNLNAQANAQAKVSKESLVVLIRYPSKVYASRVSDITTPTSSIPVIWDTSTPIVLLTYDGGTAEWEFSLGVSGNLELPVSIDELGFGISAKASGKISGKFIRLKDRYPGFFPSPSDNNLTKAAALQASVDKLFGGQSKQELKKEIDSWLEDMVNNWLEELNPKPPTPPPPKSERLKNLKQLLKDKIYKLPVQLKDAAAEKLRSSAVDTLATEIEATLDKYIFSKINVQFSAPVIGRVLNSWSSSLKSKDLISRLNDLKTSIADLNVTGDDVTAKKAALSQVETYINLLNRFNQKLNQSTSTESTTKQTKTLRDHLCYFNLFTFAGGIGANAKAGVSGGIKESAGSKPDLPSQLSDQLPDPEISLDFEAEAEAKLNGEVQVLTSRYQSYGFDGGAPLVLTQDCWTTYRRFDADASVMAGFELNVPEYQYTQEGKKAITFSYYSMTYQSISSYWLHPIISKNSSETTLVKPASGSGLCFGMTVAIERLKKASPKLLNNISKQLRVPTTKLNEFLVKADIKNIDTSPDAQFPFPKNIFLESSFAFPEATKITLKKRSSGSASKVNYYDPMDGFSDKDIKSFRNELETQYRQGRTPAGAKNPLEAIRLRVRISDFEASSETLFKLGFPVLKTSLNVDISKARAAGQEALFDYYVEWYNNPAFNKPSSLIDAQEKSVPPVVLLHQ